MSIKIKKNFFSTLLPPPNLTGVLHLGHIWNAILQDFYIKGMKNLNVKCSTYWAFGYDHAGLSLQIKFEKYLQEANIVYGDWNNKKYFLEINKWKDKNLETIISQFKTMNFSMDYTENNYTFSPEAQKIVLKKFEDLYKKGFIYFDKQLINWDEKLKTAISDSEVIYKSVNTQIYYLKYFFSNNKTKFIEVATTRIETIFGDVALFANPKDKRYSHLKNQKFIVPLTGKEIPLMFDEAVDINFGTGILKCTPAHDFLDWKLFKKHKLEIIKAFNKDKIMSKNCGNFSGMPLETCKQKIIQKLLETEKIKVENYQTNITFSERSGGLVEPVISGQWFLKSKKISSFLHEKLLNNELKVNIYPKNYSKKLLLLFSTIEDWCISRQVKWGIRFPIYKDKKNNKFFCFLKNPGDKYEQIPDVLDTWFSSALWPLIILNNENKFNKYYPIDILFTGKDIFFFWVFKMLFLNYFFTKTIPFSNIYLHGLILNSNLKKMSKSLNNGITIENLLFKYSPDVVRLFFLLNTSKDKNIVFSENKFDYSIKFLRKIENAFLFFKNKNLIAKDENFDEQKLNWYEKLFLQKIITANNEFTEKFKKFHISLLIKCFLDFLWNNFFGEFIELTKLNQKINANNKKFICYIWNFIFKKLLLIIPDFVNQKSFSLNTKNKKIINEEIFAENQKYEWFFNYLKISRLIEHELKIKKYFNTIDFYIITAEKEKNNKMFEDLKDYFMINNHIFKGFKENISKNSVSFNIGNWIFEFQINNEDLLQKYKDFLNKKIKNLNFEIERSQKILSNSKFMQKANKEIINQEKEKEKNYKKDLFFFKNLKINTK